MQKFLLIPDSFKGTMSSIEVCNIMKNAILRNLPDAEVISIPVADGGEGSVDAFLASQSGEKIVLKVSGPFFEPVEAFYGIIDNGHTAVIEMAACAGLPLVEGRPNPGITTTYGVGELIKDALLRGCKKIILGLGGSCTNDAGTGAAAALGIRFYQRNGEEFVPVGSTLDSIAHIDVTGKLRALDDVELITMCDIDNPLFGEQGAAYIFGPQKGADPEMVKSLDHGLIHLSHLIKEELLIDNSLQKGAGAAGGMGFGMVAFFGSTLQMGIETILDEVHFDTILKDANYVFTGEGKFDSQSLRGKVVLGVAKRTKKANVPLIVIAGGIGDGVEEAYEHGISGVFSINRLPEDFQIAKSKSRENLDATVDNLIKFMKTVQ